MVKRFLKSICFILMFSFLMATIWGLAEGAIEVAFQHNTSTLHPWHAGASHIAKVVTERSKGAVTFKIYPAGVLAGRDWKVMLDQTQIGTTQMMLESTIPFATLIPELFALNLPFLFEDVDHYKRFMADPPAVVYKWLRKLEAKDVTMVGNWTRPFRQLINSKRPVRKPEDLKGLKFRVPALDIFVKTMTALGPAAVPLPSGEIYTAIQLGTVDGEDNSVVTVYDFKTYEVTKYMTIWDYMSDGVLVVANKKFWDGLSKEYRDMLMEATKEAGEIVYRLDKENTKKYITRMIDHGIRFTFLTEEEKAPFKELVKPVYEHMEKIIGKEDFRVFLEAVEKARR